MIAADAMLGLLAIAADGSVSLLADRVSAGDPIGYANSVVVAPDGTVYFTDASTRFPPSAWGGTLDGERARHHRAVRDRPGARLRSGDRDHPRRRPRPVLRQRDRALRRRKEPVRGRDGPLPDLEDRCGGGQRRRGERVAPGDGAPRQPARLPGQPDAGTGTAGSGSACSGRAIRRRTCSPTGRSCARSCCGCRARGCRVGQPYGHVFAIDESGAVVEDLQDPTGAYPETTGATETADRLYIHSLQCADDRLAAAMTAKARNPHSDTARTGDRPCR